MKKSAKSRRGFSLPMLTLAVIAAAGPLATRVAVAQPLTSADVELGPWHTSGPLKASSFAESFFPEQGVDLQAKSPDGQPRALPGGVRYAVRDAPEGYDVYGQRADIEFVERMRPTLRFESVDDLIVQMADDVERARALLLDWASVMRASGEPTR